MIRGMDDRRRKSRRRWSRFSLRALLVFLLLLSVPLAWFAWKMEQARRQREAVEAILEVGASVRYRYQLDEQGLLIVDAEPNTPAWLRNMLGDDFFCDVVSVRFFFASPVNDSDLEHLRALTDLEELCVIAVPLEPLDVTDAGLKNVKQLTKLRRLVLFDTKVTDAGLEELKGLTHLKELQMFGAYVTEEGAERLRQSLPNCEIVVIKPTIPAFGPKSTPGDATVPST